MWKIKSHQNNTLFLTKREESIVLAPAQTTAAMGWRPFSASGRPTTHGTDVQLRGLTQGHDSSFPGKGLFQNLILEHLSF